MEVVLVAARLLSFPNPVNEVSARLVAGGVVIMCAVAITLDQRWLISVIAYGFVARVLTGPTLSPLGQLVTRVITPLLGVAAKPVPGPPKRFAQGIGAVLSVPPRCWHCGSTCPWPLTPCWVSSPWPPRWKQSLPCVSAAQYSPA
jgi:hypothetical protein